MTNEYVEWNDQYRTKVVEEDGLTYGHTVFHGQDKVLDQNERIRSSGMLEKAKLGLHDDEDVRMVISCPTVFQWELFKKKHNATYKLIMATDEVERMKGCKQLQILEPDWVVYDRL